MQTVEVNNAVTKIYNFTNTETSWSLATTTEVIAIPETRYFNMTVSAVWTTTSKSSHAPSEDHDSIFDDCNMPLVVTDIE